MPSINYRYRILVDEHFIRWLIETNKRTFLRLTHIKASSIDAKGEHNIMIEEDARKIITANIIKEHNLRAAFKGQEIPVEITKIHQDKYDQMVVFAIAIATERPFSTYLLTTKEHISKYLESNHIKGVKSISVKAEEDALRIINILWNDFCSQKILMGI